MSHYNGGETLPEAQLTMNVSKCLCVQLITKSCISLLVAHKIELLVLKVLSTHRVLGGLRLFPCSTQGIFPRKGLSRIGESFEHCGTLYVLLEIEKGHSSWTNLILKHTPNFDGPPSSPSTYLWQWDCPQEMQSYHWHLAVRETGVEMRFLQLGFNIG